MLALIVAIVFTLGVSFCCSVLEATVLTTTPNDIDRLRKKNPALADLWSKLITELEGTISSVLTLNTIANTVGSMAVGSIATAQFGKIWLGLLSTVMMLAVLVFCEVLPKSLGVAYRHVLHPYVGRPIWWMRRILSPIAHLTDAIVRGIVGERPAEEDSASQIALLAERGAKEGKLGRSESRIIANALSLDDVRVAQIMTPRSVVTALNKALTVGEVFKQYPNLPFGRMPVYEKKLDGVVGIVRRRDLLKAKANDQDSLLVGSLMQEAQFIPETVTLGDALQLFLRSHQKLAIVVDEYGSVSGVVTLEDVFEHLIGREIFEKDDMAVDMRELARTRTLKGPRALPGRKAGDQRPA